MESSRSLHQVLKRLKKPAGVTHRANPHALRHGFAKDCLMAGGDTASLADSVGHESVETTKSVYAVFVLWDLRCRRDVSARQGGGRASWELQSCPPSAS